jgi:hypothetical protein
MSRFLAALATAFALVFSLSAGGAATVAATYEFNNNFIANESGKPALNAVDPVGSSGFQSDTVLGGPKTVWNFVGNASPTNEQAGVTVNTTGLISPQSYSFDTVMQFNERDGARRRIADVQNRQSDGGFYVDSSNNLQIFPVSGSTAGWTNNVYHHVALTNDGAHVAVYLDGVSQFTTTTAVMNLDSEPDENPNRLLGFFLDNVVFSGQGEYTSGKVALIRLWEGVLSPQEVQTLAANPFVPEPAAIAPIVVVLYVLRRPRDRDTSARAARYVQTAEGDKNGLWTSVISAVVMIL